MNMKIITTILIKKSKLYLYLIKYKYKLYLYLIKSRPKKLMQLWRYGSTDSYVR
jgi:hypothetical protein